MKHIEEIGIIRIILILCIVIGHTFAVYSLKSAPWPLPDEISAVPEYRWLNEVFISFALQTFVFVSGYLMAFSESKREISRIKFIKKKAIRLLIPTLIFGLAYLYLIDTDIHIKSIRYFIYYLINGAGHLWFLPMLFLCFVGAAFFTPRKNMTVYAWITVLIICITSLFIPNILRISKACFYFIFFIEGYFFYSWLSKRHIAVNKQLTILGGAVILLAFIAFKVWIFEEEPIQSTYLSFAVQLLLGLFGAPYLFFLCQHLKKYKTLCLIGAWDGFMGVYIFHQFILRYLLYQTQFLNHINPYLYPLLMFIITMALSIIITLVFMNNRWLKRII